MKKKILMFGLAISFVFTPLSQGVALAEEEEAIEPEVVVEEELVVEDGEKAVQDESEVGEEATEEETEKVKESLELSLEKAIEIALEKSKDMEIVRLELDKAEIVYKDNIRGIDRGEDYLKFIPVRDAFGTVMSDALVNKTFIRNGGARMATELGLDSAKWNLEMKENEVKYNVEKAYFDLLQTEEQLQIAKENLEITQKQYDHGKLRLDVGMISQQQLLGLDFNLSQAKSNLDTAAMYYELQKMSFRNTIGLELDKNITFTGLIESKEYEEIDLEESIEIALENNGSLKMVEGNVEVAHLNLHAISGKYPDITYVYRAQAAEVAKAEKQLETVRTGVEMQVRSAVLNLTTAEKQIITYEKAVEQAAEGVRIAELSFELGQSTPTEVSQANLNLMNSKKNLSQQIHAFNTSLLDYVYSIGIGKGF